MSRLSHYALATSALLLIAASLTGCEEERDLREWTAADHQQPQAGAADPRSAPDGTPAAFDEDSALASLWTVSCASCHGREGRGDGPGKPPGAQVRDLTDTEWQGSVTDDEIAAVISGGRGLMPRFDDRINERGIRGLVGYVRRLAQP